MKTTRRSLLHSAGVAGLAGAVVGVTSGAAEYTKQDSFETRFSKPKIVPPKVADLGTLPATNISPDGLSIGIIFDKAMQLSLSGDGDLTATLVASLLIPVSAQEPTVEILRGYSAIVRGSIQKDLGTRVVLTLDLGEIHNVTEFPYGEATSDNFRRAVFSYPASEAKRERPDGAIETIQISPAPHFVAVMTLSIQRRTTQDGATVSIDSLDVEIVDPAKAPTGGKGPPVPKKSAEPRAAAK
jgi:hypothetical protein